MMIVKGKKYRIKGESRYFAEKYGTSNPIITIEDTDKEVFGDSWTVQTRNPACMLFGQRVNYEKLPVSGNVYYGKIAIKEHGASLGELVHEQELEEVPQ